MRANFPATKYKLLKDSLGILKMLDGQVGDVAAIHSHGVPESGTIIGARLKYVGGFGKIKNWRAREVRLVGPTIRLHHARAAMLRGHGYSVIVGLPPSLEPKAPKN